MLQELWQTIILLIPIFFLLSLMFGAGFFIGRKSVKRD
jgi:uncharacterized protein YneF (UPF0154 family)